MHSSKINNKPNPIMNQQQLQSGLLGALGESGRDLTGLPLTHLTSMEPGLLHTDCTGLLSVFTADRLEGYAGLASQTTNDAAEL